MQNTNPCSKFLLINFLLILFFIPDNLIGQIDVPFFGKINWISGYSKEISGENLSYFSIYPDHVNTSLLTRATTGTKVIEWETAPVPADVKAKYVYFSWVAAHSSGTSSGVRYFDLYVNDKKLLTFNTYPAHQHPDWKYATADSSALVFQQLKRDAANDAHGLAFLRLPLSTLTPGKPIKLKIVGQAQNSNDWYMVFKFAFEEKIELQPMPFILKNGKQTVQMTALHFGKDKPVKLKVNKKESFSFMLKNGINTFDIPVMPVQKRDSISVQIISGKQILKNEYVKLVPVVHRNLHFIHHSHTDIGYSHLQPEVVKIHNKNIEDALNMIDKTRDYPEAAKFKWNVESLWAVENFLRTAPTEQKDRFIKAVKDGNICLSAFYANITSGLSLPEELFHYTDYAQKLHKELGLEFNSAMISDVPGSTWTIVTAFAKAGIKYFSSGPNYLGENHPYLGDRVGHFVKTWGDKPAWWASPSGEEKVLFWTAGKGYSSWHGTPPGGVFDRGAKKIAAYLNELTQSGYPYDMVQWRYNIVSDNGPVDSTISDFVKKWNEKYASPSIILNTTDKLFEEFERKYGNDIPVVKGDITPYWEDGALSTAHEEGRTRINSLRLQQLTNLYSMLNPGLYDENKFYEAWRNILLFHEHTWGAHNSISQPDIDFVTEQWKIKKQYLLDGDQQIESLQTELFQSVTAERSSKIAVFNTSSWTRTEAVSFYSEKNAGSISDIQGRKWPLQKLSDGKYVFMAQDVPPLGMSMFTLSDDPATQHSDEFHFSNNSLANSRIGIEWDTLNGSITKLLTGDNFNYAGVFNQQGLNSYWYVTGLNPAEAATNGNISVSVTEQGPVQTTIRLKSTAPGTNMLERYLTIFAGKKLLVIENLIDKKAVRTKEAIHYGFPFNPSFKKTVVDAGYGTQAYLSDQLPGSCLDFIYGRRWINVSSQDKGVQLMLLETPMIEPDNMIDERLVINQTHKEWKKEGKPTSNWFSYVMNNYWHTNFKIDQDGMNRSKYILRPHDRFSYSETEKEAAGLTQALIAVPVNDAFLPSESLFELSNERMVITSITPLSDTTFIVRIYNPEPLTAETSLMWKKWKNATIERISGNQKTKITGNIRLTGMGVAEFQITLR